MRRAPGCLALLFFGLLLLLPFFLANVTLTALARLGLSPELSLAAALGIFLGGTINIPVTRIPREEVFEVPRLGIAMPALVPALVAAASALLLVPELAPPVAFTAGVLGPLLGADLLHLDDVKELATGMASIGGAGTFDGIVLSGLVATLLA